MTIRSLSLAVASVLALSGSAARSQPASGSLEFLGSLALPPGLVHAGVPVGGLSGLSYEASSQLFWAISDDRAERGPARILRLRIDLRDGRLDAGDVTVVDAVELRRADGSPFPARSLDPEGIALAADSFFVSSEGDAPAGIDPWVAEFGRDGRLRRELPLPERYRVEPTGVPGRGVRDNLGFEGLAASSDGSYLFAGVEGALQQEGPLSDVAVASRARLLRWRLGAHDPAPEEFFVPLDAVMRQPLLPSGFRVNGLTALMALGGERLWMLEREFSAGPGYRVRLNTVELDAAGAAVKRVLIDFDELKLALLANFEGMALGPKLPDGRTAFLVVSDDNFNTAGELTTFLLFALADAPGTVARIQGAGHRSPWEGRWVWGVEGVVTGIDRSARTTGLWIESSEPDGDAATSEGVFVASPIPAGVGVGERVRVHGRVEESVAGGGLPVTRVAARAVGLVASAAGALPPPVALFAGPRGRSVPEHIEDDAFARFEPNDDAIDFWESFEGMRVEVPPGTVVGPRLSFGEFVLLPDGVEVGERTGRGGVRLSASGPILQRVFVGPRLLDERVPDLSVGDRVSRPGATAGSLAGIVDYSFSNYKFLPSGKLAVQSGAPCGAVAKLRGDPEHLTVGNFNVENLSAAGEAGRFKHLAAEIVVGLGAPAILALQEIQDDSGPADDGVVAARETLGKLAAAIAAAGGPRYQPVSIDPENNREGGQPGGNIRVSYLYDPQRVGFERRGDAGATDAVGVDAAGRLSLNPGRIAPVSEAFVLERAEGVRRSLAAEFTFNARPVVLINNHWSSRYEEDRAFGAVQPPRQPTTAYRLAQAKEIRAFVERTLAADPAARVLVLGDLNDFEWTTPIQELARPPLENLMLRIPQANRYSYNFEGASQVLDHAVVSPALAEGAEVEEVHLNSDCADALRTSDHDPLVVRLRIR